MRIKHAEEKRAMVPGPAAYEPDDKVGKNKAPVYTMRQKTPGPKRDKVPGAGTYHPSHNNNSVKEAGIKYSIGNQEKCPEWDKRRNPGPGLYEQNQDPIKYSPPKRRFGTENRKGPKLSNMNNPGPGTHEYETELEEGKRKNKGKTFGLDFKDPKDWKVPGVGTYEQNPKVIKNQVPHYSIGKEARVKVDKEQMVKPGPGTYDPEVDNKVIRDPAWKFGTDSRKPLHDDKHTPGPDHYIPDDKVGKNQAPAYTMRMKTEGHKKDNYPGAGTYNPSHNNNSVKEAGIKYTIGNQEKCPEWDKRRNPGPGDYEQNQDPIKYSPPKRRFGTENRKGPKLSNMNNPGPGTHNYETELEEGARKNKGKTFGLDFKEPKDWKVPGVGTYEQNPKAIKNKVPHYSIGMESRVKEDKEQLAKPGPGTYDPEVDNKVIRDPAWKFGTDDRKPLYDDKHTPGPDHYEPNDKVGKNKAPIYTMRMKTEGHKKDNFPGAGTYNPSHINNSVKESGIKYSIGNQEKCPEWDKRRNPGPGDYEQNQDPIKYSPPKRRFGTENRKGPKLSNMNNPGPGTHEYVTELEDGLNKNKGKTFGLDFKDPKDWKVPGVGTYEQNPKVIKNQVPHYSIGRESRVKVDKEQMVKPGPGTYDPEVENKVIRDPAWKFGTDSRKPLHDDKHTPGPDHYIPDDKVGKNKAPSYTMRMKTEGHKKDNFPGAGTYNPSHNNNSVKESGVKFSIGNQEKCPEWDKRRNPGPGDYEQNQDPIKHSPPKRRFGTENRKGPKLSNMNNPGPGTHEYVTELEDGLKKNKGKTFGLDFKDPKDWKVPGVGTYEQDPKPLKNKVPHYSIGRESRVKEDKEQLVKPGPGTYDPEVESKVIRDPAWKFGTDNRKPLYDEKHTPGPGIYDPNDKVGKNKAPSFTMRMKTKKGRKHKVPGAGTYNPNYNTYSVKRAQPRFAFGKAERTGKAGSIAPGPGNYNQDQNAIKKRPPSSKFGTERRSTRPSTAAATVGPGAYEIKSDFDRNLEKIRGSTMVSRRYETPSQTRNPGPGAYNPNIKSVKTRPASCKLGRSMRGINDKETLTKPGPGAYNPLLKSTKIKAPNWGFGSEQKGKTNNLALSNPPPDAYMIKSSIGTGKKWTMGAKKGSKKRFKTPGPGVYNPSHNNYSVKKAIPAVSIGTAKRKELRNANPFPGPGTYHHRPISGKKNPKFSFGKQKRGRKLNTTAPGPGFYESENFFDTNKRKTRGYSVKPKRASSTMRNPGPGAYNTDVSQTRPRTSQWKMGKGKRFEEQIMDSAFGPGPGAYEYEDNFKGTRAAKATFGKNSRNKKRGPGGPGPGRYRPVKSGKNIPKYSMRKRGKNIYEFDNGNPGPGNYDPKDVGKRRAGGAKIGMAKKGMRPRSSAPGPGTYKLKKKNRGQKTKFGTGK